MGFYAHRFPMKQPSKKIPASRSTTLSLDPEIKAEAQKFAEEQGNTLTGLVERLLLEEIATPSSQHSMVKMAVELRNFRSVAAAKLAPDSIPDNPYADTPATKQARGTKAVPLSDSTNYTSQASQSSHSRRSASG